MQMSIAFAALIPDLVESLVFLSSEVVIDVFRLKF